MTIAAAWPSVLAEEVPSAFVPAKNGLLSPPKVCKELTCGFIDGQIQMVGGGNSRSWQQLVQNKFVRIIDQMFQNPTLTTVVMAFDDSNVVSPYKSMTQTKRVQRACPIEFEPSDELPEEIPSHNWSNCMANRAFKQKVIAYLCQKIPDMVDLSLGQKLIIDYRGSPLIYRLGVPVEKMHDFVSLGESDVKFTRYVSRYGSLLVHAIDGDYLAISLLYYARNRMDPGNRIVVYRYECKGSKQMNGVQARPNERRYEYVDVQQVYTGVLAALQQCSGFKARSHSDDVMVTALVGLMLLCGTDFSRGLPQLGPKTIWDMLPDVFMPLLLSFDPTAKHFRPEAACDMLVSSIYSNKFPKHCGSAAGPAGGLDRVLASLQTSKLSIRKKETLPSRLQIDTTIRNVNWVLYYWSACENSAHESPLDGSYGFVVIPPSDKQKARKRPKTQRSMKLRIAWTDVATAVLEQEDGEDGGEMAEDSDDNGNAPTQPPPATAVP